MATSTTKKPVKTKNRISWTKSVKRFEHDTYRADVPVGMLEFMPGNPQGRLDPALKSPYKTKQFWDSIALACGPIEPITVVGYRTDEKFTVCNGNSRGFATLRQFGENYLVSVTLVEGADAEEIYGLLNNYGAARPIAPRDKPEMFAEHPTTLKFDEKVVANLRAARKNLGEEVFAEFAKAGKSYHFYSQALRVSRYCGWGEEGAATVVRWMLRCQKDTGLVEQHVIRQKTIARFTPEQVVDAIGKNKSLGEYVPVITNQKAGVAKLELHASCRTS